MIGVALLGLGRIGKIHLPNILGNSRLELLYIVEENVNGVNDELAALGRAGKVTVVKSAELERVLSDARITAVVICTPTDTHADLSIRSMEAGKHVLCEKPLAEGRDAVSRCYDVAEKRGLILMAAFNRRFDPSYRSLYTKVRAGEVGDIQFIRTTFRDTPLWLGAETFSQTFLSHDIDIVCWFAGGLPESVVCVGACHNSDVKENGDVDSCVVTMKFPGEIIGVIDFARYCSYGYDIRLEVFGTKGMLKMDPCLQTTVHEYSNAGKRDPPFAVSFPDRFKDAYLLELDHFIDAVEGKNKCEVTRFTCTAISTVIDAIRKSFHTQTIVKLSSA